MSVLPVCLRACLPACLPAEPNELPDPAQGRAIPRWNRLGKRNRSMKKNPASRARAPAARENVLCLLHKLPQNDFLELPIIEIS